MKKVYNYTLEEVTKEVEKRYKGKSWTVAQVAEMVLESHKAEVDCGNDGDLGFTYACLNSERNTYMVFQQMQLNKICIAMDAAKNKD